MWTIQTLALPQNFHDQIFACDGFPTTRHARDQQDGVCRIMVGTWGYLDIEVIPAASASASTSSQAVLRIQDKSIPYEADTMLTIVVITEANVTITSQKAQVSVPLTPIPQIAGANQDRLLEMITNRWVPYQNPPSGVPKSDSDLQALADRYYPNDAFGYDKAMCLYDWTSASFIRQDLFHQLRYTALPGEPLDLQTMARVIWGCNYPGYTAADANFMNQFDMNPATSEADVYNQLLEVHSKMQPLALAEMNVQIQALLSLPKPTVKTYPQLYRGAMPMSGGYNTSDFAPSLFEYAGNAGPATAPLIESLEEALQNILQPGKIITTKGPWSFSNDLEGAKVWQNGILITCNPPEGADTWPGCADITAFSLNPSTFEINVPPVTRYRIDSWQWITLKDKPVCHFTMTMLGYCGEPMLD